MLSKVGEEAVESGLGKRTSCAFDSQFGALMGFAPLRWQRRLFLDYFMEGNVPAALDLPTGLGKTSVMAVWYLALKAGASVPRRLVYVVDRRAVVDQATTLADQIKCKFGDDSLSVSTLRGQYVDNRQWLIDLTAPAIVIGTVDMIGSRLLFSGYGVSRKMRPYHAALLGNDALIALDEAHLVPPFESLLQKIAYDAQNELWPRGKEEETLIPRLRLMSLSATGRDSELVDVEDIFRLIGDDYNDEVVVQRLNARKLLTLGEAKDSKALVEELARRAWELGSNPTASRVLVYSHSREDALKIKDEIKKLAKKDKKEKSPIELLIGQRRVHERETLFLWLKHNGFIENLESGPGLPTFLIATSAGEVGVDLDADHMVCDLVEWERMVQRFGRVNRRGTKDAKIEVIAAPRKSDTEVWETRFDRLRKPIDALKGCANPEAIASLGGDGETKEAIEKAKTPPPLRPALTRALVDSWSMTSIEDHTGRPEVQPWLRGWVKDEAPQTTVIWRTYLPVRSEGVVTKKEVNDFFDAAPPQTSEMLEAQTAAVVDWLIERAMRTLKTTKNQSSAIGLSQHDIVVLVLDQKDELEGQKDQFDGKLPLGFLADLDAKNKKKEREKFERSVIGRTLVVSRRLAGLKDDGTLDESCDVEPLTIDKFNIDWDSRPFRIQETTDPRARAADGWKVIHRFAIEKTEDGDDTRWLVVEQSPDDANNEDARALARNVQFLNVHEERVAQIVVEWASVIWQSNLPASYVKALKIAAELHDEGKGSKRWQRAFNAPHGGIYAKTEGPINQKLLDGYRHEFGSLPCVKKNPDFATLHLDLQDLVLHLVAAHHGGARPLLSPRNCDDLKLAASQDEAREVTLRFARLQRRWGPWGLVWWEVLLRAADQKASSENEKFSGSREGI